MERTRRNRLTGLFVALTVLAVTLMLISNFHRTSHISLPAPEPAPAGESAGGAGEQVQNSSVSVTPETVQTAIATLSRPSVYQRKVQLEQFWDGGSGSAEIVTRVYMPWTRTDRTLPNGETRHVLTDGETTYVWYQDAGKIYVGAAGGIDADNEQMIPTYEDILQLAPETIITADYRLFNDVECIYTESLQEDGSILRYWVSVADGLLAAAEREEDGTVVYRMSALAAETDPPAETDFLLPDGTTPGTEASKAAEPSSEN